jgi:hypothetical protein
VAGITIILLNWTNLFPPQISVQPDVGFEIRPFPVSRAAPQKAQARTFFMCGRLPLV